MASPKSKFVKTAMQIIDRQSSVFKALEEFESAGKTITKKRLNFTIDRELAKAFRERCKKNNLNMSRIVEELIRKYLSR